MASIPKAYLTMLDQIADHPVNQVTALPNWNILPELRFDDSRLAA